MIRLREIGQWLRFKIRTKAYLPYMLGVGLVFFITHSPDQLGIQYFFLPQVGLYMIVFCFILWMPRSLKKIDLGPKYIWIPLAVIVASMFARLVVDTSQEAIAGGLMGIVLFLTYLMGRGMGKDVFKVITVLVVVEAISCIIIGVITPGIQNGGIINWPTRNYDIATGVLVFGSLVSIFKYRWMLVTLALVGLYFTGAEEAVVAIGILSLVVIARRDYSKKIFVPLGITVVGIIIVFSTGAGQALYDSGVDRISTFTSLVTGSEYEKFPHPITNSEQVELTYPREFRTVENNKTYTIQYDYEWEETLDNILFWRWTQYKRAIQNFSVLGNGYNVTNFKLYTVHNVPLIIVDQIGIIAALAWLFVTIACIVRTKWKYAFIGVLALGLFDHFIWTQMAPYWWLLVGVASSSSIVNDYIFKGD